MHKAFILGAGLGTRLRPLTNVLPKPLVPLFHEPMVNYALRHLLSAGISKVAINTHHIPDAWEKAYPDAAFEGASLSFFHEPTLLETGGGIKNIAPFIADDPLLVYNGDILTDIDLSELMAAHAASDNVATLALFDHGPNTNVAIEGDKVVDLRHARGIHAGTHQFSGIYCINPEILDLIPANEKISIVPAFLALAEKGRIGAYIAKGATWHDIGTRDSYLAAHDLLRAEKKSISLDAIIHPDADICHDSCIIGPRATIGAGAKLRHTIVWPDATVAADAELTHCIVATNAQGYHEYSDL